MSNPFIDNMRFSLGTGETLKQSEIDTMTSLIFQTIKANADPELMTVNKLTYILEDAITKLKSCHVEL